LNVLFFKTGYYEKYYLPVICITPEKVGVLNMIHKKEKSSLYSPSILTGINCILIFCFSLLTSCSANNDDIPGADGDMDSGDIETTESNEEDGDAEINACNNAEQSFDYGVPLDPDSPWPKFRHDAAQTGAAPFSLCDDGRSFWSFKTGKGIFSSPVIGADGTIYIGSADRIFYAINPDGSERWRFESGEIIDSSALLDDKGRVYFGSGDGYLYALKADSGEEVWRFLADDPSERDAFIRWFEGNVAIDPKGRLILGNDNWYIYAINRDSGERVWRFETPDQTWSLAAVDSTSGNIFIGNNNLLLPEIMGNVFAIDKDGNEIWKTGTIGTMAASPLLTSDKSLAISSFDGFVYSFNSSDGSLKWKLGTRDHVYSSAALHNDGYIVIPSTDGTVYALDPDSGEQRWAFDWGNPIRSSPAIDGNGLIYMGTGDGYLLVLNPDGSMRWALRLIKEDRDDLNASPALGPNAVYLAGENGEVFGVPFDFCLRDSETDNPDCLISPQEPLDDEGAFLLFITRFGSSLVKPPAEIEAHEPMAFSLMVREQSDTILALIETESLQVTSTPAAELDIFVSAARQFFIVYPKTPFVPDEDGNVSLSISGNYLINPERTGLKFDNGTVGGTFSKVFKFKVNQTVPGAILLPIPEKPGDPAGVWQMSRLSAPLPTILPSYNQIGFDAHHFLIGLVEGDAEQAIAWGVEMLPSSVDSLSPIPDTSAIMVFNVHYQDGHITLENNVGFSMGIQGTTIPFNLFRMTAALNDKASAPAGASVQAVSKCSDIPMYGTFLQSFGFCHPETDLLVAYGAVNLEPWQSGVGNKPEGIGEVTLSTGPDKITAAITSGTLPLEQHTLGILLVDSETGALVVLDYGKQLTRSFAEDGSASVELGFDPAEVPDKVRAYFMLDVYPAARQELEIPAAE